MATESSEAKGSSIGKRRGLIWDGGWVVHKSGRGEREEGQLVTFLTAATSAATGSGVSCSLLHGVENSSGRAFFPCGQCPASTQLHTHIFPSFYRFLSLDFSTAILDEQQRKHHKTIPTSFFKK